MAARPDPFAVQLRPMGAADIDAVMAVELSVYPYPWTEGIFRDCLRVGYCCWIADSAAGIAGYFVLSVATGDAHLLNLCVAPDSQRSGLGRRMLRHALRLAREHGGDTVFLEVRPSNEPAIALYRNSGFVEVGMRRGYYPAPKGEREDALVLALVL